MIPTTEALRNLFMAGHRQVMRITTPGGGDESTMVYAVVDGEALEPLSMMRLDSGTYGDADTRWYTWAGRGIVATGGFTVTEADIIQGGLTVDAYSMSTERVELGAAVASELSLSITNPTGTFDDVYFEGVELHVELGVKDWSTTDPVQWISLGFFTVDDEPESMRTIVLTALDRMVYFDRAVNWNLFTFPCTLASLVEQTCNICDIPLGMDITSMPNSDYVIVQAPNIDCDYRNILQWAAFMMATCAMIDENGELVFRWYEQTGVELTTANRYSHKLARDDVNITGIRYTAMDGTVYIWGEDDYTINFAGCALLTSNVEVVLLNIWNAIKDFSYRPFQATIKSAPFLQPMDMVEYVEADGTTHECIISAITFTGNKSTPVSGKGESNATAARAKQSAFTREQRVAVDDAARHATDYIASDNYGLMIVDMSSGESYTPSTVPEGVKNTYIDDDSFDVRNGTKTLASFGETSTIGNEEDGMMVRIRPGVFDVIDGDNGTITHIRSSNVHDGRATTTIRFADADGTKTTTYSSFTVDEILSCIVESTGEPYELPSKSTTSEYAIVFSTPPTEPVIIEIATYDTLYDIYLGTRGSLTRFGSRSISIGFGNKPYGMQSIVLGNESESFTNFVICIGNNLNADVTRPASARTTQTVLGRYNEQKSGNDIAFQIGTGTSDSNRKNALEITTDDELLLYLDTNAAQTTTDGALYKAISDLGWTDVIE